MKKLLYISAIIAFSTFFAMPVYASRTVVEVFYWDDGGGCYACHDFRVERELAHLIRRTFGEVIDDEQVTFSFLNLHRGNDIRARLSERADLAGIDEKSVEFPAFFTQENYYFGGDEAIELLAAHMEIDEASSSIYEPEEPEALQEPYVPERAVISPRKDDPYTISVTDSVVVYFYTPWCPFCYEISPIMDNLPEYVIVNGRRSYVKLISLNRDIPEHHDMIRAYHEKLNIPPERQFVPLVLIGDRDLFLYDEVSYYLLPALKAGEGLTTPLFTKRQAESNPMQMALPLALIVIAGAASLYYWIYKKKGATNNEL